VDCIPQTGSCAAGTPLCMKTGYSEDTVGDSYSSAHKRTLSGDRQRYHFRSLWYCITVDDFFSGRQGLACMRPSSSCRCRLPCACLMRARDRIIASAPILAWRKAGHDVAIDHAPTYHPRPLLRGNRVHTLLCRGSGLPLHFPVSPLSGRVSCS